MSAHPYHSGCGCFSCGKQEESAELRDESLDADVNTAMADFETVREACSEVTGGDYSDHLDADIARALMTGDWVTYGAAMEALVRAYLRDEAESNYSRRIGA
jgi:hypothetical protein